MTEGQREKLLLSQQTNYTLPLLFLLVAYVSVYSCEAFFDIYIRYNQ
jgi:hypothetical protein